MIDSPAGSRPMLGADDSIAVTPASAFLLSLAVGSAVRACEERLTACTAIAENPDAASTLRQEMARLKTQLAVALRIAVGVDLSPVASAGRTIECSTLLSPATIQFGDVPVEGYLDE